MLRRLSQIYDVPFSENSGKALIASLAGSMIPATSGIGAASVLKTVPVLGTIAASFVMPALSAGATYAVGKAFIQHFESGGTLLDFNPPDYREFIKAQKEMWDSRARQSSCSGGGVSAVRRSGDKQVLTCGAGIRPGRCCCRDFDSHLDETDDRNRRLYRLLRAHGVVRHRASAGFFRHVSFSRSLPRRLVVLPLLLITGPSRGFEWRRRS